MQAKSHLWVINPIPMSKRFILLVFCLCQLLYAQQKPNIIIIISDDHAFQTIGAYGSPYGRTPNIDRLAKAGKVFDRAYVTNSLCGPSRAVLLTGKYSHKNGFKENENSTFDHSQNTFVKELQAVGYNTAWIGKQHLGDHPQGFDFFSILDGQGHYFNPVFIENDGRREQIQGYVSDIITDKSKKWLETLSREEPFCLVIGHKATHRSWMPDPKDFGRYDDVSIPLPDNFYDTYTNRKAAAIQEMTISKDMQLAYDLKMYPSKDAMRKDYDFARFSDEQFEAYYNYYRPIQDDFYQKKLQGRELVEWKYKRYMIDYLNTSASLDRNIGEILDYVEENGLEKNTIIIYLSDQGFYMGEHGWFDKRFMYEESFRTPMIIKTPGGDKATAQHIQTMVMNVDIAPTLLELASVDIPKDMQGKSFARTLSNPNRATRDRLYYHYYEDGVHAVSPHFGISDGRFKLVRFYGKVDSWELYDLKTDSAEMNNIFDATAAKKIVEKMKKKLITEIKAVDDQEALDILTK